VVGNLSVSTLQLTKHSSEDSYFAKMVNISKPNSESNFSLEISLYCIVLKIFGELFFSYFSKIGRIRSVNFYYVLLRLLSIDHRHWFT
jgi:hypothetical protein